MTRSRSLGRTFAVIKPHKTPHKTRIRHVFTPRLSIAHIFAFGKGFFDSFSKDKTAKAESYTRLITNLCEYAVTKVDKRFNKALKKISIECDELSVHYSAADDRIKRTVIGIKGYDRASIQIRRRYNATTEREHLYRGRTAIRHALAGDIVAIKSLYASRQLEKDRIGAKVKIIISKYLRGLTRGKNNIAAFDDNKISEMIGKICNTTDKPDIAKYSAIVDSKEDCRNV